MENPRLIFVTPTIWPATARCWRSPPAGGPIEWQLYLESLPRPLSPDVCAALDAQFHLTGCKNYDVLATWLERCVQAGYEPVLPRVEQVLGEVGRMKYLRPLYKALADRPDTRSLALDYFHRFKDGYHPIAEAAVERVLNPTL